MQRAFPLQPYFSLISCIVACIPQTASSLRCHWNWAAGYFFVVFPANRFLFIRHLLNSTNDKTSYSSLNNNLNRGIEIFPYLTLPLQSTSLVSNALDLTDDTY